MLQGPAALQLHKEEVKTLVGEAVQAREAEHAAELANVQKGFEAQLQECEADLKERDRCRALVLCMITMWCASFC